MSYSGMEGVSGTLEGPMSRTVSGMVAALKDHRVVSAADDFGAVTAWRDDAGTLRAERHYFCGIRARGQFTSMNALRTWLKVELPKISEPQS